MLQKIAITDIEQFDKAVRDAQSIVIYGSRRLGRLTVDYLIETGNRDKIAAIVHTRGSKNYQQDYRQIPILEASAFFAQQERKDALVIVCVRQSNYWNEIYETMENYGVQTCAYLHQMEMVLVTRGTHRSDMRSFIFTEGQLCDLVDHANEVVIYSTKERGDRLVNYLERVGRGSKIQENIRLIEEAPGKYSVATPPANPATEDALVLVVPDLRDDVNTIANFPIGEIKGLDSKYYYFCTAELMERLFLLLKNKFQGEAVQEIQFLVAGFPKCGTTSLHYVLQRVEDIHLPDVKESFLLQQRSSICDPKEKFLRRFYNKVPKNSVSGCVEPSFAPLAKEIREMFGSDLRVCLLMRNPVGATYSLFKMRNRNGNNPSWFRYDRYGKYCKEMLDDFITVLPEERESYFEYADFLEDFLQYYPAKKIKVVFFEELIREPGEKINEILRFIGSKAVYDPQLGLPKENTGDFVWADQEGMALGMKRELLRWEKQMWLNWNILDDPETALARANEIENELFRLEEQMETAEKIYNPKMTPEQRKRLEDFYRPSVRKLEKMLDKDLSKLWFE